MAATYLAPHQFVANLLCHAVLCLLCCVQGRDANKKLQRAIKAGKMREKMPGLIGELRGLLAEWKDSEGEVSGQLKRGCC